MYFYHFLCKIRPKVSRSPPSSMSFIQIICVILTFVAQFIGILYTISWIPILTSIFLLPFPKNYHFSVKSNMFILTRFFLNLELILFYTRIRDALCNITCISVCTSSDIVMMKHHTKCHMIILRRCTHYNVINFLCCTHCNILLI